MTAQPLFNASSWITANCVGAHDLRPETIDVVANFALMWNFFEGAVCDNRANIPVLERVSEEIGRNFAHNNGIERVVKFWTSRYWTGTEFRNLFDDLHFRKCDRREIVEAVLRGDRVDFASKLFAVLIIVYRLRNNLFHGLKTIDTLNDQVANLNMACCALASVLELRDVDLIRDQNEPN